MIYVTDLADAFLRACYLPAAANQELIVAGPKAVPLRDMLQTIARPRTAAASVRGCRLKPMLALAGVRRGRVHEIQGRPADLSPAHGLLSERRRVRFQAGAGGAGLAAQGGSARRFRRDAATHRGTNDDGDPGHGASLCCWFACSRCCSSIRDLRSIVTISAPPAAVTDRRCSRTSRGCRCCSA